MSEIKDNKDIEEVKESEARYNKPCKPDNLCCACKDGPTVVKNESQCKEQCCKPKTVRCPDIREAKCIPAFPVIVCHQNKYKDTGFESPTVKITHMSPSSC